VTNQAEHRRDEEEIVAIKPTFGTAEVSTERERRHGRRPPTAAVLGIVLVILAAGVFFALPRWVAQRATVAVSEPTAPGTDAAAPATVPAAPQLSPEELAALEAQAESLLASLLQQRSRLEAQSAARWGAEEWMAYEELARSGDQALLAKNYAAASEHYTAALAAGAALLTRAEQIIVAALATAAQALSAGNAQLASEQYELVLAVEPANAAALAGRARAERLPAVLALVQRADESRQRQSLEEAAELYREALALDPEWTPASTALAATSAMIATARFETALSRGFAALAEEEYADAQGHFKAALALDPNSKSAIDGLAQAEQGQKLEAIALAEARALAFERREMWKEAIERYEAALAADSTLAFAIAGLERARARADLDIKLENLLANPNLLLTDSILTDAQRIADQARAFVQPDTRIGTQVERLDELIRVASTPLTVALTSDEQTEVTVYRVGALGVFATREIQVRPGTYTAVGSRNGYRDVRETFTVLPGRDPPTIRIICSEPIG
jgi:tetratricopeptide (TPR) repeat protein